LEAPDLRRLAEVAIAAVAAGEPHAVRRLLDVAEAVIAATAVPPKKAAG
jgi:hypothetical protein